MLGNIGHVGVTHIPHIEDDLVESSNATLEETNARKTGTRAKNYKKLKHKNSPGLSSGGGSSVRGVDMTRTAIKSSSQPGDSTNSIHSKTQQIQPSPATEKWRLEIENNESTETTVQPALAYDDNYYQETLEYQFRDDGSLLAGGAWPEPSYNFSGLEVEPAGDQMLSFYSFCLLVDNQFE